MTNVRRTDDKNQLFIVCLYLTKFFRADKLENEQNTQQLKYRELNKNRMV